MSIDTPALIPVAELSVRVSAPIHIGEIAGNTRRVIPIEAGEVCGERLNGRVVPGGADFQMLRSDGISELEARYVIETGDGALIYVENRGIRCGPPDLLEKLRLGQPVDPKLIYFRSSPRFETAAPQYRWLMQRIFVASGARHPDRVELKVFEVS